MFNTLSKENQDILEQYSRGESYEVLQFNLEHTYGLILKQRHLGNRMGEIKKQMRCQTQFEMGYKYALSKIPKAEATPLWAMSKDVNPAHYQNLGLNQGLIFGSIFWLIMIGILYQYVIG